MTDVDNQKQDGRVRNWSWIVYPDSAPENWRSILDETGEKWIESPLHDKDINETTNEIKKPH
ncbi:Rep family protein, partial [Streptococcus anginosus]